MAYNRIEISRDKIKEIRLLFVRQIEMKEIESSTGLKEHIIRRVIRENNWSILRERYLRFLCYLSYVQKISLQDMSKRTGIKAYTLCRIHRKYETLCFRTAWNKRISDGMEKAFILKYNDGKSSAKIAKEYGFKTDKTVLDILKKNSIERRSPKKVTFYDEKFFEKIDSEEKAYILGLIMTDGYIIKDYIGIGIQLTKEDGYILDNIAAIIGAKHGTIKIKCDKKRKNMPNAKDMVRLTVHSRKISEDIKKLGVVRKKSKIIRYNGCVPDKYMSSFFRGLIDGDGTVGINSKNGNIWCQICSSSKKFIEDLSKVDIGYKTSINKNFTNYKGKKSRMYTLRIGGGNEESIRFLKWIYHNKGEFYLRRKYAKVQSKIS